MFVRFSPLSFLRGPSSSNQAQNAITRHLGFCALLGLAILICGCSFGKTKKDASVKAAKNVTSPAAELSARNQSLLGIYSAEIETAADKIMFQTPSTDGRRQALAWKAEAIPILQNTMLKTDPVAAIVDTWAFIHQMKNLLPTAGATGTTRAAPACCGRNPQPDGRANGATGQDRGSHSQRR